MLGPVNLNTNETPAADPLGMTDIEDRLRGPDGEAYRQELLNSLTNLDEKLTSRMAPGLAPDEFERARLLRLAVASAKEIVLVFRSR